MIDHQIIATGSKGNAVVIGTSILIDCGVSFRKLSGVYKNLKLVLLTHRHSDHFNPKTIRRLAEERPALRFGCPTWLVEDVAALVSGSSIDVYDMDECNDYGIFTVQAYPLIHNVPNCAYQIKCNDGQRIFYATDTGSLDHIEASDCDLYMVESNYGEDEITERIRKKQDSGAHCYEWAVLNNHLSQEKAYDWLYANMGAHSQYVLLHGHEKAERTSSAQVTTHG